MTAAVSNNRSYQESALKMRLQVGLSLIAITATILKIADLNPLAAGIAVQTVIKAIQLSIKHLPHQQPGKIMKSIIGPNVFCAAYTGSSQLDLKVQAIFYLALFLWEVKEISLNNVWSELIMSEPMLMRGQEYQSNYQITAQAMRWQIGASLFAFMATTLKIADLKPLALGIAIYSPNILPMKHIKKLPQVFQLLTVGSVLCAVYSGASMVDLRLQAIGYLAFLAFNIAEIHPRNAWKELTNWRTA
jgi:hypothetical protein